MTANSLADDAYLKIREKLMNATYMPGLLLSENELAEELEMSRTPIRKAISRLEAEGFLSSLKNRGIIVKEISLKEEVEQLQIISMLQDYSVDAVLEHQFAYNTEELKKYLDMQIKAEEDNQYFEYLQAYMLFIRSMVSVVNNATMLTFIDSVKDKFIRGSMINYKMTPHQKHYSLNMTNQSIYEAICSENYTDIKRISKEAYLKNRERLILHR